jgi:hypothetical protein
MHVIIFRDNIKVATIFPKFLLLSATDIDILPETIWAAVKLINSQILSICKS